MTKARPKLKISRETSSYHRLGQLVVGIIFQLGLLSLILSGSLSFAQPWYFSVQGTESLTLQNNSAEVQHLWLAAPNDLNKLEEETHVALNPHGSFTISLDKFKDLNWLQVKSYLTIPVTAEARNQRGVFKLQSGRSENVRLAANLANQSGILTVANLSPVAQEIRFQWKNFWTGDQAQTTRLEAFQQASWDLDIHAGDEFEVLGHYPLTATWQTSERSLQLVPFRSRQTFSPDQNGAYFLMSNPARNQSFVIHAQDPAMLEKIRSQIGQPGLQKILIAKIDYGHGDFNRDLLNSLQPAWSWHVSEILGFSSLASQSCDGSPALVEDYLNSWIVNPSEICFWNYKVLRELSLSEITTVEAP